DYPGGGAPPHNVQFVTFKSGLLGGRLLESVLYEPPEGGPPLFGVDARRRAEDDGKKKALVRGFKMDLLSKEKETYELAVERMRHLFVFLRERYCAQPNVMPGQNISERTCVSYPAKWLSPLRDEVIQAAIDAGFANVKGM